MECNRTKLRRCKIEPLEKFTYARAYRVGCVNLLCTGKYLHRDDRTMLEQRDRRRVSEMHRCNWNCIPGYDLSVYAVHASFYPFLLLVIVNYAINIRDGHSWQITRFSVLSSSVSPVFPFFLFIIQRRINGLVIYMIVARANFVNLPSRHVTRSLFLSLWQCNKNRRQFSQSQRKRDLHSVETVGLQS